MTQRSHSTPADDVRGRSGRRGCNGLKNHKGHTGHGGTAPTRAMIRRMQRTRLAPVPAEPATRTPAQVITDWREEYGVDVSADAVAELSSRLHRGGAFYFADDGALQGSLISETLTAIGDALDKQADLIAEDRWPERNRLRMLVDRYQREIYEALGGLGLT